MNMRKITPLTALVSFALEMLKCFMEEEIGFCNAIKNNSVAIKP